jgi:hypothetical protein
MLHFFKNRSSSLLEHKVNRLKLSCLTKLCINLQRRKFRGEIRQNIDFQVLNFQNAVKKDRH